MTFLSHLITGISLGSIYAIIALGYTMVYGIAKMLNFAHGDVIMVGAYICFFAVSTYGLSPVVGILLILLVFYRALSRKVVMRQAENEKFLSLWYGLRDWVRAPHWPHRSGNTFTGRGFQTDAGKRCFKCPSCGQKCRVPKGKGTIAITCPRCGQDFIRKT